jgi:hypothetical protein
MNTQKLLAAIVAVATLTILCWSPFLGRKADSTSHNSPGPAAILNSRPYSAADSSPQLDEPMRATGATQQAMKQTHPLASQASQVASPIPTNIKSIEAELAAKSSEMAEYSISMAEYLRHGYIVDPDPESATASISLREGAEVDNPKGYANKYVELKSGYLSSKALRNVMEARLKMAKDGALRQRSK